MKFTGRVWKFGDEINTDLIFPHSAFRASPDEQCRLCMSDNRPGWSDQVRPGDILIAGKNFGTGSSRPGAAVLSRGRSPGKRRLHRPAGGSAGEGEYRTL